METKKQARYGIVLLVMIFTISYSGTGFADLTVEENGNVGIGIAQPSQMLHIHKQGWSGARMTTDATGSTISDGVNFGYDDSIGAYIWNRENSPIIFSTDDAEKMRIKADGNIAIGMTSNAYGKLQLKQTVDTIAGGLAILNSSWTRALRLWVDSQNNSRIDSGSTGQGPIVLNGNGTGSVGIGTTNPTYPLDVKSSSTPSMRAYNAGYSSQAIRAEATGDLGNGIMASSTGAFGTGILSYGTQSDFFASGPGVNYAAPSSKRWKRNIENMSDALGKVRNIRGVYFDWDEEHGGKRDSGFIAEEIGQYFPEIVAYEEDGVTARGMDYGAMTPILAEAIKELERKKDAEFIELRLQIQALINENDTLRSNLDDILARISKLEKK